MVVLSLNGPAESIDVRSSDRVIGPSLGLKGRPNADGSLTEITVAVDAAILAAPCNFNVSIAQMGEKLLAEMLKGPWGEIS